MAETNGTHVLTEEAAAEILCGEPLTAGYKPSLPLASMYSADGTPYLYVLRDIESMIVHPSVLQPLNYYKSGIASAEVEFKASDPKVADFAAKEWKAFFQRSRYQVQRSYEYGWGGLEILYKEENGQLCFDGMIDFNARDIFVLSRHHEYAGVRVKKVQGVGSVDLWGPGKTAGYWTSNPSKPNEDASRPLWHGDGAKQLHYGEEVWVANAKFDIPAKGFWFAHDRRYHLWYGRTQCLGAWRPWRRLATQDGAESVVDHGVYRFAFKGPTVRYPMADLPQKPGGYSGYTTSPSGQPLTNRDKAREYAENVKAGASAALPSSRDDKGNYLWDVEWPDHVLNVDSLLNYCKALEDQCSKGIGVPPELLEASETGSGYSGRAIPMEAFFTEQQRHAEALFEAWKCQIGDPLVAWNFGRDAWFVGEVKPLLATKQAAAKGVDAGQQQGQPGQPGQQPGGRPQNPLAALMQGGRQQLSSGYSILLPFAREFRRRRAA